MSSEAGLQTASVYPSHTPLSSALSSPASDNTGGVELSSALIIGGGTAVGVIVALPVIYAIALTVTAVGGYMGWDKGARIANGLSCGLTGRCGIGVSKEGSHISVEYGKTDGDSTSELYYNQDEGDGESHYSSDPTSTKL